MKETKQYIIGLGLNVRVGSKNTNLVSKEFSCCHVYEGVLGQYWY